MCASLGCSTTDVVAVTSACGPEELCADGVDNDCDGTTDEPQCRGYPELDAAACPPERCPSDSGLECGLLPQCGCPCDQSCQLALPGVVACRPPGPGALRDRCSAQPDCARGLACANYEGGSGLCLPFCFSERDCDGFPCVPLVAVTSGERPEPQVGACALVDCDVLDGTGCPDGLTCRATTFPRLDLTRATTKFCGLAGGSTGAACDRHTECPAGHLCADSQCSPLCDVAASDCSSGQRCGRLTYPIELDGTEYGACLP